MFLKKNVVSSYMEPKSTDFNFDLIADYFNKKDHKDEDLIDDRFCDDIDFDDFFMFADRTISHPGQQYLYNQLREIPKHFDHLNDVEENIAQISSNQGLAKRLRNVLSKLSKHDAYYINTLFQDELVEKPKWFPMIVFMAVANFIFASLMFLSLKYLIPFVFCCVINLVIHYWNKKNIMVYIGAMTQLIHLKNAVKSLKKEKWSGLPSVNDATKSLDDIGFYLQWFKLEGKLGSDATMFLWGLIELFKIAFLIEPIVFFGTIGKIKRRRGEIEHLFEFIGQLDMASSIQQMRSGLETYCKPVFRSEVQIDAEQMFHPLIPECVNNDLRLQNVSVLLTGSNMSGKTTFIRTVALNALSAYTMNTCFAKQMQLSRMKLLSCIRVSDDLLNSKSYYFEEVQTVKRLIDEARKGSCLFLLDELFKGTNTIERIAIANAVLKELGQDFNLVFAATHDLELTEMLEGKYQLYHFCEDVGGEGITFDYQLKRGVLRNTNAVKILDYCNYPEEIIKEASTVVDELKEKKVTANL